MWKIWQREGGGEKGAIGRGGGEVVIYHNVALVLD